MSKRNKIVAIICIVIATLSFMGGMMYKYEDYEPIVEYDMEHSKFYIEFNMPLDVETAYMWLDWSLAYHQYMIDNEEFTELTREEHSRRVYLYNTLKILVLKFEEGQLLRFEEVEEWQGVSE